MKMKNMALETLSIAHAHCTGTCARAASTTREAPAAELQGGRAPGPSSETITPAVQLSLIS